MPRQTNATRFPAVPFSTNNYPAIPGTNVSLLTDTSKMPTWSFSIPAMITCPFSFGSLCEMFCYAMKGRYVMPNVKLAQELRLAWLTESLRTTAGTENAVDIIRQSIMWSHRRRGKGYFRIHDAGDMYNVRYANMWHNVIQSMPDTKFWIPTRAWHIGGIPADNNLTRAVKRIAQLPNAIVRPSALNLNDPAPDIAGLHAGTMVVDSVSNVPSNVHMCPAYTREGKCGDCKMCWNRNIRIAYPKH